MSELSYKHDTDNGLIELMANKEIIATWVCDGGDPEVEFANFKKIYRAGQASAVMNFVNTQVCAFELNFAESCEVSLFSLYRFAQHHVKDNYNIDLWGEELTIRTRSTKE